MTEVDENLLHSEPASAVSEEVSTHVLHERDPKGKGARRPRGVRHFTPSERTARGKGARRDVPRSAHGEWQPGAMRRDPVDLLEEQAQARLPELGPIRYGRMLVSPFAFFRGAAYLMAADLADGPRTGLHAQLCGDAHLSNFGTFAAPDRRRVFSINDFDETLPGPFEWDVKRLAASFAVAGRERGFGDASVARSRRRPCASTASRWRASRRCATSTSGTHASTSRPSSSASEPASSGKQMKRLQARRRQAHTKDSLRALSKLCRTVDGELRIVGKPPLVTPIEDVLPGAEQEHLEDVARRMIRTYRRTLPRDRRNLLESYRYVHAARKVVGVGSVGARTWILLLVGRDDDDPLFLQFKEAQTSVLEPFLGKSQYAQHGQRVVEGQRMMQAAPDIMLGWERIVTIDGEKQDFYIRQLWDAKGSADIELMDPAGTGGLRPDLRLDTRAGPTRAPATGSRSPPISATAAPSTVRWRHSPRRTRTRTRGTTARYGRPSRPAASLPSWGFDPSRRDRAEGRWREDDGDGSGAARVDLLEHVGAHAEVAVERAILGGDEDEGARTPPTRTTPSAMAAASRLPLWTNAIASRVRAARGSRPTR